MNYETYEVKVYENGDKEWFQNGKHHRTDGPAVEWANGTKAWYQNGEYHRLDGPAIELADGDKDYWIKGKCYSYEDWKERINAINKPIKEMTVSEISKQLGYEVKIVKE